MENETNSGTPDAGNIDISKPEIVKEKTGHEEAEKKANSSAGFFKRNPVLFTVLMGIVAVVAVYFWKDIQAKNQKAAIVKKASEQIMENNQEMLKLVTKPFVWSIRSEMIRGNMDLVNDYTKEMVREKNFQFINIIAPDGLIINSTDKKLEGQMAGTMFEESLLTTDSVMVVNKDGMLTIAAPVMGYDKKLGTLIMNYTPVKFVLDTEKRPDSAATK